MKGLLFDTSMKTAMVALSRGDEVVVTCRRPGGVGHSAFLLKDIETLLQGVGWGYGDIDFIGAGTGPGSFTGVRVAVSTAKGLAFSMHKPIAAICSMDAIALSLPREMPVLILVDAGRRRVYAALYQAATRKNAIRLLPITELHSVFEHKNILIAGPAVSKYHEQIMELYKGWLAGVFTTTDGLTAQGFLKAAMKSLAAPVSPVDLTPLYLQDPSVRKAEKHGI